MKTKTNWDAVHQQLHKTVSAEKVKNHLPNLLQLIMDGKGWEHWTHPEGRPYKDMAEFLVTYYPSGAGCGQTQIHLTYEDLLTICQHRPKLHRYLCKHAPNKGRGGDRKSEQAKRNGNQKVSTPFDRGGDGGSKSRAVLTVRLAQEYPEYYNAFMRGEYKTATEAATAAGILKSKASADFLRAKSAYRKLTPELRSKFHAWLRSSEARKLKKKS